MELKVIAHIQSDFKEKFGIPRQSGISDTLISRIVFTKEYRNDESLRGLDGYSHIWVIWQVSESMRDSWSPTVRPPRLGGNKRMGVFATRSPFRPNPLGLSSLKLVGIEDTREDGKVLLVAGADMLDGTPIYDIKPYLAFTDSHPEASGGFADGVRDYSLSVSINDEQLSHFDEGRREALIKILENDPRPSYQDDENREYIMNFANKDIHFKVSCGVLTVICVDDLKQKNNE